MLELTINLTSAEIFKQSVGARNRVGIHCKKWFAIFPSPAWMSLIKLSLDWNNLIILAQGEFGQ